MRIKNKRGFEFSFGWIFAIIVGAIIIFLAVYAANSLIKQEKSASNSLAGKELGIILNPIETSIEEGKSTVIELPGETRVYNGCKREGNFGMQEISVSARSGVGKEWESPGAKSVFYNKYIFSASVIEGKNINVLSKQFKMPFKVADVIFIWSDKEEYCFVDAPSYVSGEIKDLKLKNVNLSSDIVKCPRNSKKICFGRTGCDIDVNLNSQSVKIKGMPTRYYEDDSQNALLYAAVFSDPEIYECQVKRLMKRTSELSGLYLAKSQSLSAKGCNSNLEDSLFLYLNTTAAFNSSIELRDIKIMADELDRRNSLLACNLFEK